MTIKTRRILYILFILIFVTITPLIIAYAAGYQLVFSLSKPMQLQKTGMLILNSTPPGAKIYLNGEVQQIFSKKYTSRLFGSEDSFIVTPAKIKNVLPGEYEVSLEKDGYWHWMKKLTVKGGESTYAEDVFLFKNNLPLLLAAGDIKNVSLSPDKKIAAIISGDELLLMNMEDETARKTGLAISSDILSWSNDGKKIIAGDAVYDLENYTKIIDLKKNAGDDASDFQWDDDDKNKIIYISSSNNGSQNTIKKIDISSLSIEHVVAMEKIYNYFVKDRIYYLINKAGEQVRINIYDSAAKKVLWDFELSKSDVYTFINPENRFINIFNRNQKTLYLMNPDNKYHIEEIINDISFCDWVDKDRLLYNNDFEIWFFDARTGQKILLTRIGSAIQKVILHPSENYVIFITENSIQTIELDDREKRNITELFKSDKFTFPTLSAEGDGLYFGGKLGNQEGLYKLSIQ